MSDVELDYQITSLNDADSLDLPDRAQVEAWVYAVLDAVSRWEKNQITVRIVNVDEMIMLNETYRHKQGPTNVLSFPFEAPEHVFVPLLGDIVICASVVIEEAKQFHKPELDHWAHMVIHGALHLLGYDHISDTQAQEMESLEISILSSLGISNPYIDTTNNTVNLMGSK